MDTRSRRQPLTGFWQNLGAHFRIVDEQAPTRPVQATMRLSAARLLLLPFAILLTSGCLTVGGGITERQWNSALKQLEPGLTQQDVLALLGEPRERRAAAPDSAFDTLWIYSRPEIEGTRSMLTGEHDILLPNGKNTLSVPHYEDRDVRVIAEYHLHWTGDTLAAWKRVVDRLPGH